MSDLHVAVGASLLTFSTASGSYFAYKLHNSKKSRQTEGNPIIVLLSETLAAIAIGILNIYCYSCTCQNGTDTIPEYNITTRSQINATVADCETKIECTNWETAMEQIVLTATAVHCLFALVTTSYLCKNGVSQNPQPSTSTSAIKIPRPTTLKTQSIIGLISAQWLLPILGAFCLFYSMKMADVKDLCENLNSTPTIIHNFQTLVSELLETPLNTTEKSTHDTEIDKIVGKVYSIVESATDGDKNLATEIMDLDEGFEVVNIIDKLKALNNRTPKQLKPDHNINTIGFKIYTLFFIVLVFIVPIIYSAIESSKLKISIDMQRNEANESKVQDVIKYLNMLIISVLIFWTPSVAEIFTRTYITGSQPNIAMQILMTIGSSHMLLRNGLNVKLLKILVGQDNTVQPKA